MTGLQDQGSRADAEEHPPELTYMSLFGRFVRFGLLAFGGPVAQIAMIRRELVEEEKWIGSGSFNRLLAVLQALPGPEAHELCVHLGIRAKGRIGGVLAGLGFMLPGFLLMLALAWAYTRLTIDGTWLGALLIGVQVAVLAVILRAVHRIGEHILTDPWLWAVAILSAAASAVGMTFWIVLPSAAALYALLFRGRFLLAGMAFAVASMLAMLTMAGQYGVIAPAQLAADGPLTTFALFVAGLKGGLLTFGGAYTAIPFVRDDTVGRGWMSDAQFLDGLALSGVLPAPLVIFVTFVGYVCGGLAGALVITAGMFLPAFAFSLIFYERLEGLAEHKALHALLAGVAAAVVGLIAITLFELAQASIERSPSLIVDTIIFVGAVKILYMWKSKLATPLVLSLGGIIAVVALT